MATRVLVIEDSPDISALVAELLDEAGYEALQAGTAEEGLKKLFSERPGLVILDLGLPGMDGMEVLERIRPVSEVPILILTARDRELDKVRGLQEGADDYVTKPFASDELIARVEALLRRSGGGATDTPDDDVLSDSTVVVDFVQVRVTVKGQDVSVTPLEFRLLSVFVRNPKQVLSSEQLSQLVWGDAGTASSDQVSLHVGNLRRKLREQAAVEPIETVRGFGYRYLPSSE